MRDIKFRAFSKKAQGMVFLEYAVYIIDDEIQPISDYVIMQYTGLKDKNGVEIYEGDIVKAKRHNFEDYDICVIKYFPISYVFEVQHCKGNYIAPRNWHQHFEVIGNIYENPELLK